MLGQDLDQGLLVTSLPRLEVPAGQFARLGHCGLPRSPRQIVAIAPRSMFHPHPANPHGDLLLRGEQRRPDQPAPITTEIFAFAPGWTASHDAVSVPLRAVDPIPLKDVSMMHCQVVGERAGANIRSCLDQDPDRAEVAAACSTAH